MSKLINNNKGEVMTIKNSDMPAMPQPMVKCDDGDVYTTFDNYNGYQAGLTKREMFAMHAPDVLDSFKEDFIKRHHSNKSLVSSFTALSPKSAKLTIIGEIKLIKEWSYAYADLMLED